MDVDAIRAQEWSATGGCYACGGRHPVRDCRTPREEIRRRFGRDRRTPLPPKRPQPEGVHARAGQWGLPEEFAEGLAPEDQAALIRALGATPTPAAPVQEDFALGAQ